jgi:hypothetical protein
MLGANFRRAVYASADPTRSRALLVGRALRSALPTHVQTLRRAISCDAPRRSRYPWHRRQPLLRNLLSGKGSGESESHSLRHNRINKLARSHLVSQMAGRPYDSRSGESDEHRKGWKRCGCLLDGHELPAERPRQGALGEVGAFACGAEDGREGPCVPAGADRPEQGYRAKVMDGISAR